MRVFARIRPILPDDGELDEEGAASPSVMHEGDDVVTIVSIIAMLVVQISQKIEPLSIISFSTWTFPIWGNELIVPFQHWSYKIEI